jgi:16S rRNA C967 or C1407 C5-methylase (RsmB/RsmF family)
MKEPSNLLLKLSHRLFSDPSQQEKFMQALMHPQSFHPCILWLKPKPFNLPFPVETAIAWQPPFVDRLSLEVRPGQYSLHDQGYYYCLDFSSVFAASTLLAIPQPMSFVLDLCAAPGGKSLFAWKTLQPKLLLSNEVIGKRVGMLISNLKRCGIHPAVVLSLDPQVMAQLIPETIQVVLVDAPCTGQSLLAKGGKAPGCFHPIAIKQNASRQKRILANAARLVAPQGYLAYMTCAFSLEENERVSQWFLNRFPQFQPVSISHLTAYQSHLSALPCYRIWPQDGLGAGAFTILMQNTEGEQTHDIPADFLAHPSLKWSSSG